MDNDPSDDEDYLEKEPRAPPARKMNLKNFMFDEEKTQLLFEQENPVMSSADAEMDSIPEVD